MSSHHCWLRQYFHERVKGPFRFQKQIVVSPSLLKDCQLIFIKINVTHCRPFSIVPFLIDLKALGMKIPKFVCYNKSTNVPIENTSGNGSVANFEDIFCFSISISNWQVFFHRRQNKNEYFMQMEASFLLPQSRRRGIEKLIKRPTYCTFQLLLLMDLYSQTYIIKHPPHSSSS